MADLGDAPLVAAGSELQLTVNRHVVPASDGLSGREGECVPRAPARGKPLGVGKGASIWSADADGRDLEVTTTVTKRNRPSGSPLCSVSTPTSASTSAPARLVLALEPPAAQSSTSSAAFTDGGRPSKS